MARGRSRKAGVRRDPSGRSRGGPREDARGVALAARVAHTGLDRDKALDALAGSVLGRLRLSGAISPEQHAAAESYGALVRRHASIMGYRISPLRSSRGLR
jgi:hypothetical protein